MTTLSNTAVRHWTRIITRWPIDRVRPDTVSFQKLMQQRLQRFQAPSTSAAISKGKAGTAQTIQTPWNENKELKQVNALYALLENRFEKEAPLPDNLRHPSSAPAHYEDIVIESERAPSRGLLEKFTNKLRGMIRLS